MIPSAIRMVIGQLTLQNQLLFSFLREKTGNPCSIFEDYHGFFIENSSNLIKTLKLILIDCYGLEKSAILEILGSRPKMDPVNSIIILFNLNHGTGIENEALTHQVRGFLYRHDCADTLLKALEAVLAGEIWMSRKKITECLLTKSPSTRQTLHNLTKREVDILTHLFNGDTNKMIGDKLYISPHTVKTHMANIFKKIKVVDRRQAVLWASRNL